MRHDPIGDDVVLTCLALNGNEIPDALPEELVPASMRDIDTTVNFMRDLLKHDASTRSNTSSPGYGGAPVAAAQSKDATMYKHDDSRSLTYKPSGRHIDRKSVRYNGEDSSADIGDIRRQLQNTSALLDRSNEDSMRKSAEDEEIEQEMDDLKYRVKRIQDDIEYVSKGRRSTEKDEERRKLERELLFLMHEKLPELERRQQQREDERRMEERAGVRARDKRNDLRDRHDRDDRNEDRDWLRGTYDRDRDRDIDRDRDQAYNRRDDRDREYDRYRDRDLSRERERDRDYRPRSPPRSPPPVPPSAPQVSAPPRAPPTPTSQASAAPSTKNMTAEERTAFIREQAQRRIQDRLKALGVDSSAAAQPTIDKSVEERLEREKLEAVEKANVAEKEQEAREQARQVRVAGAGGTKEDEKPKSPVPANEPLKSIMKKPKASAPAPAPPPSRGGKQAPAPPVTRAAPPPLAAPSEDPEEVELRRKEEAMHRAREERKKRLQEMEQQEEEERKKEETLLAARQSRGTTSQQPTLPSASTPPVAPPAPPVPSDKGYNPFRKPTTAAGATPSPLPASGASNPFFKPPVAAEPTSSPAAEIPPPPPPPPPPAALPVPSATQARAAFSPPPQDDWEEIQEREVEDSESDDDYANSRASRGALASALFGNLTSPTESRPGSAAPTAPPAPKAPPPALQNLGGGDPDAGRGALLSAITGGARLKKAQTIDRSGPAVSGKIVGDDALPAQINNDAPLSPSISATDDSFTQANRHRQSVDWYAGLAADQSHPAASHESVLESTNEEEEPSSREAAKVSNGQEDELSEFDFTKSRRLPPISKCHL